MNERIKELAKEAVKYSIFDPETNSYSEIGRAHV